MNRREKLKPGDTVVWEDGTVGIITERIDIYKGRSPEPEWSWIVKFPRNPPKSYNERYGECAQNLRNKAKEIIHC